MANVDAPDANIQVESKVFISYSRKDMTFADRLDTALRARGFEPLIDRAEIYAFEDWWKRVQTLISQADTVIFVLSPQSVASKICADEIAYAVLLNKRIAPIVYEPVQNAQVPEALARLNFIFFDDPAKVDESLERLCVALETDIQWIRKHTEYGEAARRWVGEKRPAGLLLRSPALEDAEHWIGARPRNAPMPTLEMQGFIRASRSGASRRRNILTGSLASGLVIAIALAGFAYWQRGAAIQQQKIAEAQTRLAKEQTHIAELQKARAEKDLGAAKNAVQSLIFELGQGLQDVTTVPLATIRAILNTAQRTIDALATSEPNDKDLQRSRFAMHVNSADVYLKQDDVQDAKVATEQALAIARLRALDKTKPETRLDLWISLIKLGDVKSLLSDTKGALAAYQESLEISSALAKDGNADGRRDLTVSLDKIGDVEQSIKDFRGALAHFEESLAARRLSARNKTDLLAQIDLIIALEKVGEVQTQMQNAQAALSAYEESLADARILSENQLDAMAQRSLSVVLVKIGDAKLQLKDTQGALVAYAEALPILRSLAKDGGNAEAQSNLSGALSTFGDVKKQINDEQGALAAYEESLPILQKLAENKGNTQAQVNLWTMFYKVGEQKTLLKDLQGASAAYGGSLQIAERLAIDKNNKLAQQLLSISLDRIGTTKLQMKDGQGALAAWQRSLAIRRAIAQNSDDADAQHDLSVSLVEVAILYSVKNDTADALALFKEASAITEKRALALPDDTQTKNELAWVRAKISELGTH